MNRDYPEKHRSDCEALWQSLLDFMEHQCQSSLRMQLDEHVRNCPSCQEKLRLEQQVRMRMRNCCQRKAPVELRTRIVSSLRIYSSDNTKGTHTR